MAGKIILLNGASSAGKSTLAEALQVGLPEPFLRFSLDLFFIEPILPKARIRAGDFAWSAMRPNIFAGFHACLTALAGAGNNLVVDHIIESAEGRAQLEKALAGLDVFFVGVHCPLPELERREAVRGDRDVGDARRDLQFVHTFGRYDIEVDSTHPLAGNVATIVDAWQARQTPGAFFVSPPSASV